MLGPGRPKKLLPIYLSTYLSIYLSIYIYICMCIYIYISTCTPSGLYIVPTLVTIDGSLSPGLEAQASRRAPPLRLNGLSHFRGPALSFGGLGPAIDVDTETPPCTSIKGLMVSIRWYLGSLKGSWGLLVHTCM